MTESDAFALGFLDECAGRGVDPSLFVGEKRAFDPISPLLDTSVLGGIAMVGAPLALGALGGRALGSMGDVSKEDVSEAQASELADYYGRQTDRLKRLKQLRDFHDEVRRVGRRFV